MIKYNTKKRKVDEIVTFSSRSLLVIRISSAKVVSFSFFETPISCNFQRMTNPSSPTVTANSS
jgi:hypothetical protein